MPKNNHLRIFEQRSKARGKLQRGMMQIETKQGTKIVPRPSRKEIEATLNDELKQYNISI